LLMAEPIPLALHCREGLLVLAPECEFAGETKISPKYTLREAPLRGLLFWDFCSVGGY